MRGTNEPKNAARANKARPSMSTTKSRPTMHKIPVYDVRLVKSRRPLMLAEPILPDSDTSARALHALIGLTDREHFVALFLNARHQVTGAHIAAIGGQHTAGIDLRAMLRAAIVACASAIILGHNHSSGDPAPSSDDLTTTAHIMRAANILLVPVVDHVIVTREVHCYHSMSERGTLPTVG